MLVVVEKMRFIQIRLLDMAVSATRSVSIRSPERRPHAYHSDDVISIPEALADALKREVTTPAASQDGMRGTITRAGTAESGSD